MKALVGAFNQEKALVGAFSVIVQPVVEPMEHCTALVPGDGEGRHGGEGAGAGAEGPRPRGPGRGGEGVGGPVAPGHGGNNITTSSRPINGV